MGSEMIGREWPKADRLSTAWYGTFIDVIK